MTNEEILFKECMKNPVTKKAFLGALETITDVFSKIKPVEESEDYVSRQAVLEVIDFYDGQNQQHFTVDNLRDDIENIPPVTPAEKVGQWIFHESFDNGHKNCNECIECSQCHTWLGHDCYAKTPYCPICGAKMQEAENGCI